MISLPRFKHPWDQILLVLILLTIIIVNFSPATWLIGWDNLMPEFNIWMNLKRSFFAVWQEYQGLGLVGGMGHATDLIRQLILLPFTLILPNSLIRYLWHFAMLFLGTFGIYFGLKKLFCRTDQACLIPTIASLFYLLNFGTIQYFWVPLESFSTFWGFFPWLIFSLWDYLNCVWNRHACSLQLKKLIFLNILAIPSFYVQTIFLVYLACIFLIIFAFLIRTGQACLPSTIKIVILIFLINSFWLLPFGYFLKTNLTNPVAGIGNFMSSDESFDRNLRRGYISDFLLLRGYYFDFPDTHATFMAPWGIHFSNNFNLAAGYLLSLFVLIGIVYSIYKIKKPIHLSLLLILSLVSLALLSATPPFSFINQFIRQNPLLNQVFRAPFTKFIVPAIFVFSIFTAYGLQTLVTLATRLKYSQKIFTLILVSGYLFLISIFSFPVFRGQLFYSLNKQSVPKQYFQMFDYFRQQSPTARIANLPQGSFWGWTSYRFGIVGSGFIWYDIEQPILDRAFDAWNLKNEQYYWELTTALQSRDPLLLSRILSKYSIEFVLFDDNIFFPSEKIYSKTALSTKDFLSQVPGLSLEKQFDKISIYRFHQPTKPYLISSPPILNAQAFFYTDFAFIDHPDYLTSPSAKINYPYLNLFTNRLQSEITFDIKINNQQIQIGTTNFPLNNSLNQTKNHSPLISNTQQLVQTNDDPSLQFIRLTNIDSSNLIAWNFPDAAFENSYLLRIIYRHHQGLPLTVSATSENLNYKFFYTRLDQKPGWQTAWFIIPRFENYNYGTGINVIFNNTSLSYRTSQNDIQSVDLYPLNYYPLASTQLPQYSKTLQNRQYLDEKSSIFFHKIKISSPPPPNSYLVLPQTFSPDWLAFYFDGLRPVFLPNHQMANNWANSWEIPDEFRTEQASFPRTEQACLFPTIYILFWPQLLEFAGFGLLIISLIYIFKSKSHKSKSYDADTPPPYRTGMPVPYNQFDPKI